MISNLQWNSINDKVMGGKSKSTARLTEDAYLIFEGMVSLENNGGFASIKSSRMDNLDEDITKCTVSFQGDGKTYHLRLYPKNYRNGVAYTKTFKTTQDSVQSITIFLDEMEAHFRGTKLPDLPKLKASEIAHIGFMIKDKQEGAFQLGIQDLTFS